MSDIDKATGLSTKEWNIHTNGEGRFEASWKNEPAYEIVPIGKDHWSLSEDGHSLGAFTSLVGAAAAMPVLKYDPWEDIDGQNTDFYVKLAATNFDEWVSDETSNVFLRREDGSWWLSAPNQVGQSEYPTRLQGMIAGLELYEASYAAQDQLVIASLELDANDWRVEIENGSILATYRHDESITLQADSDSTKWTLYNDDEPAGKFLKAKDGAAAVPVRAMTL